MIILDYQDRRPIYEQVTEIQDADLSGGIAGWFQTSFCPAAGNGIIYQPEYDSESLYDTGAGGTDLSGKRQREFCCRDAADSGKKQRRFSKRISGTCQTWNQHRYDRRRLMTLVQKGYEEEQR